MCGDGELNRSDAVVSANTMVLQTQLLPAFFCRHLPGQQQAVRATACSCYLLSAAFCCEHPTQTLNPTWLGHPRCSRCAAAAPPCGRSCAGPGGCTPPEAHTHAAQTGTAAAMWVAMQRIASVQATI